jgi:uncharacterized protein YegP (UPF0339 family)
MATATTKARAARQVVRQALAVSESAAMKFLVFEDNAGDYRWMILGGRGDESLAQSGTFPTYEDAAHDARVVRDGAGSARFESRPGSDRPVDLVARREAAVARDDSDAERWLDEGGSFSSEAVTQWRAGR